MLLCVCVCALVCVCVLLAVLNKDIRLRQNHSTLLLWMQSITPPPSLHTPLMYNSSWGVGGGKGEIYIYSARDTGPVVIKLCK